MDLLILGILAGWLGLTVVHQISHQRLLPLWNRDVFSLVPRWTFFTPRPVFYDYYVLFRDELGAGVTGTWQTLPYARRGDWRWREMIWAPEFRYNKVLSTLAMQVVRGSQRNGQDLTTVDLDSDPYYRALRAVVINLPRPEAAVNRQFMILKSFGLIPKRPPQVVFVSKVHPLRG